MTNLSAADGTSPPAERLVVLSIDGLAPRSISWSTMPRLCRLAHQGASTFTATTVTPPVTLPAHASMLRGVPPTTHGVVTNQAAVSPGSAPSFLSLAAANGHKTAVVSSWEPMLGLLEVGATAVQQTFDGGYGLDDDDATINLFDRHQPDVSFVYLSGPDLVGHTSGWLSDSYLDSVSSADRRLGKLLDALPPDTAVVVTTDHGGDGRDHQDPTPETITTFVVVRSALVGPRSLIESATILDIAPTVADIAGFDPDPGWTGESVLRRCGPLEDRLIEMLRGLGEHEYGERLDMLSHSLQTAGAALDDGADDSLVAAALLHDVGHVLGGPPTEWGLPDHAEIGARYLQAWFGPAVIEPIRLHVDAKRYLTATDPTYAAELSQASTASLVQQGGPFTATEAAAFQERAMAADALRLRRYDDCGKVPVDQIGDPEPFRRLLRSTLDAATVSAMWARDACECGDCRDPHSDQHLIDATDLIGWSVTASDQDNNSRTFDLRHEDGRTHRCRVPLTGQDLAAKPTRYWGAEHTSKIRPCAADAIEFTERLAEYGIALIDGRGTAQGTVLDFAAEVGFVRVTNYGRLFDVITEEAPINLAFTAVGLPLHTDNPYRDPVPTTQLLHCLQAAEAGGGSIFSDGFSAAHQLRENDPDAFELLTTTPARFEFRAGSVHLSAEVPLIRLDAGGDIDRVTINNRSMRAVELGERTQEFYRAYLEFARILALPQNSITLDLLPGELIGFDNRRVLHGRSGFAGGGARHLQGCYVDINSVASSERVAQ